MPPSLVSLTIKKTVLKNVQQPFDQRRRLAPRLRPPRPPVARPGPRWGEVRKPSMGFDTRRAFPAFELLFFPFQVAGSYFELNTEPVVYIGGCRQPSRIESNRVWRRLGPFGLIFFPTASYFRRRGPSALHARLHARTLFIWSRRLRKGYLNPGTTKQPFLLCLIFLLWKFVPSCRTCLSPPSPPTPNRPPPRLTSQWRSRG